MSSELHTALSWAYPHSSARSLGAKKSITYPFVSLDASNGHYYTLRLHDLPLPKRDRRARLSVYLLCVEARRRRRHANKTLRRR